jgi:beta-galactosidase/beta-glucuronidase
VEFVATVRYQGKVLNVSHGPVQDWHASCGAVVRDPDLWSPGRPALYDVTFELRRNGEVLDRVESYFGFRQVTVEEGNVVLNGEPVYLKFVLDQGYWPESIMTPPSDEAILFDIRATKEMGFNGARKHQKVEDPRYLYWADKCGLLVSAEMANAYLFDDRYVARITREWVEVVQRDFNHPSIVIWVPVNESWGVPNLRDRRQQAHLRAMYNLTKSLDQTRLVIDNDGWEHTDHTDLFAIHDYTRTGEMFYERFKNVGRPGVPIPAFAKPLVAPGFQYNGSPVYLSEFGGIAYVKRSEAELPTNSWGYAGIEATEEAALKRMRGIYEAVARLPVIKGICYTQLVDVEQEINGLMTYDRQPKFEFAKVRELNELLR